MLKTFGFLSAEDNFIGSLVNFRIDVDKYVKTLSSRATHTNAFLNVIYIF